VDERCHALPDGIQKLRRHIHAGHHVLEDECLVFQFSPLYRREWSTTGVNHGAVQTLRRPHRLRHVHATSLRCCSSPTKRCAYCKQASSESVSHTHTHHALHQTSHNPSSCICQLLLCSCPVLSLASSPPTTTTTTGRQDDVLDHQKQNQTSSACTQEAQTSRPTAAAASYLLEDRMIELMIC